MHLIEEILLLMLDEQSAALRPVSQRTIALALGGAALMDLQLAGRIDTDLETLVLTDRTPLGDDLLDPLLVDIAETDTQRDAFFWVEYAAERSEDLHDRAIARLVEREILIKPEDDGVLSLTPQVARVRRYPSPDDTGQEYVTLRIMRLLFDDDLPDPEDISIICLANACGLFPILLSESELKEAQERIDLFSRMDLIGQAIIRLVHLVKPALEPEVRTLSRNLPAAPCLPIIGNSLAMRRDYRGFLTEQYQRLGPVFRIRVATDDLTILAGPEANRFLQRKERLHLRTSDSISSNFREVGTSRLLLAMNGNDHVRMRREMKDGFSRRLISGRLPDTAEIVRRRMDEWPLNEPLPGHDLMQRIAADQVGTLSVNTLAREYLDDIVYLTDEMFRRFTPHWSVKRRFREACRRVERWAGEILAAHQLRQRGQASNLVHDLIDIHRADPAFLAETDLQVGVLSPFIFGIHTAGSITAFLLYFLLKHPELQERVRAEADALFAGGPPTMEGMREMDVTHRAAMETLRMYPTIPITQKKVVTSFDFGGYRIPAGGDVYVALTVPHHLPQCFPEPERFDIDRYLPGREEHKQPGAYAPFGLGMHRCLGSGFAEVQIALTLATLLHHGVFELDPPGYEMKLAQQLPLTYPHKSFRIRMVSRR